MVFDHRRQLQQMEECKSDSTGDEDLEPVSWAPKKRLISVALLVTLVVVGGAGAIIRAKGAHPVATPASAGLTVLADEDNCFNYERLELDKITRNNLGGRGPDSGEEGMYVHGFFYEASKSEGTSVDLHLNALSAYDPGTSSSGELYSYKNGLKENQITVRVGKSSEVEIGVKITKAGTDEEFPPPKISFTWFDIDGGEPKEEVDVEPVQAILVAPGTKVTHDDSKLQSEGLVRFHSQADGVDSPENPYVMTEEQFERGAEVRFQHTSKFTMALKSVTSSNRAFILVGFPSLECAKTPEGDSLPTPEEQKGVESTASDKTYCLLCLISGSLAIPPCADSKAFWNGECA
jgi:hypothetical protein